MGSTQEEFMTEVPTALTIRQDRQEGTPVGLCNRTAGITRLVPQVIASQSPIRRMISCHLLRAPSRTALICGIFNTSLPGRNEVHLFSD